MTIKPLDLRQRIAVGGLGVASFVLGVIVLLSARIDPATTDSSAGRFDEGWVEEWSVEFADPLATLVAETSRPPSDSGGESILPLATRPADVDGRSVLASPVTASSDGAAAPGGRPVSTAPSEVFAPARFLLTATPEA